MHSIARKKTLAFAIYVAGAVCSKEQQQMDPDELHSSLKSVLQQVRVGALIIMLTVPTCDFCFTGLQCY